MTISVILAHPTPGSFNHAIADAVTSTLRGDGHRVAFHDLYAERFDPLLLSSEISREADLPPAIAHHCREIAEAEGIVIVHPDWWGMPPAILKGWIDRVLRQGVAYRFAGTDSGEGIPAGLLAAREQEVFGDPLERLWKDCIFSFCGVPVFRRQMFGVVVTSTEEQSREWLAGARRMTRVTFPPV